MAPAHRVPFYLEGPAWFPEGSSFQPVRAGARDVPLPEVRFRHFTRLQQAALDPKTAEAGLAVEFKLQEEGQS